MSELGWDLVICRAEAYGSRLEEDPACKGDGEKPGCRRGGGVTLQEMFV